MAIIESKRKIIYDIVFDKKPILTKNQIKAVIDWMNTWEQLKDTVIPIRFKEDFTDKQID